MKSNTHHPQEQDHPDSSEITEKTLNGLPPSAKLVLKVLEFEGTLTQKQLADETRLPQRTVRQATSRLIEANIITERTYVRDARQTAYTVSPALQTQQ